ncbi:MAG: hypothetical protein ACKV0T_00730 [Planctomycetales bacterium]
MSLEADTLLYGVLFLVAPLVWWWPGAGRRRLPESEAPADSRQVTGARVEQPSLAVSSGDWSRKLPPGLALCLSLVVGGVSWWASARIGQQFAGLPPAYHDEYSYWLQAETFLAGRMSSPSPPEARLFDQMHVLNEGRFASRYFPGTGIWMASFVAAGHPWWGHWMAGALCATLVYWCGRELAGEAAGFLAGLLTALAPGMALFSNLLLAHHPTLVGLGLFLLGFLRSLPNPAAEVSQGNWWRDRRVWWGMASGIGLGFAALCRPMTAAAVAFPLGVYLMCQWIGSLRGAAIPGAARDWLRIGVAMVLPLLAAGGVMLVYNQAITGSVWKTPYALYTEIYTPRHVYGFNNVLRGEQHLGSRVLDNYDRWAENLTPSLAFDNARRRWIASWKWTLGLIPLAMSLLAGLALWPRLNVGTRLVLVAIVSLHAAHVPYWFVGMQNYHYVFESGPLWMLWLAAVSVSAMQTWRIQGKRRMPAWWVALLGGAVIINHTVRADPAAAATHPDWEVRNQYGFWSAGLDQGLSEIAFARRKYRRFEELLASQVSPLPALVLIEGDPADRHIDYCVNSPELKAPILRARYLPESVPLERVRELFPDRSLFLYQARSETLRRLDRG